MSHDLLVQMAHHYLSALSFSFAIADCSYHIIVSRLMEVRKSDICYLPYSVDIGNQHLICKLQMEIK